MNRGIGGAIALFSVIGVGVALHPSLTPAEIPVSLIFGVPRHLMLGFAASLYFLILIGVSCWIAPRRVEGRDQ